jgi:3D-(3,5/4)-trihydroxycyclohexane-1,2-dione acylhydrolase (decyclizing)
MAQAMVRFLAAQMTEVDGRRLPIFAGVWAIFGHGNVAGLGEALHAVRDRLPTFRGHNEQTMAHAAIAYTKAMRRRRFMIATTSIGPGATNMVTAAAVAHVNRLPLLLLPGDVFASRRPDPVLQQIEDFGDGTVSVNDCFRPVSRYFDRITRPEQIIPALGRAMAVLTDPAECGPVTLALCQDVQAEAYDYPESFFAERLWRFRRPEPDRQELAEAVKALWGAKKPVIIVGGGVRYSRAEETLGHFAVAHGVPMVETQAGKSALADGHALNLGAVGVTGTAAANRIAAEADVVLAVGTRLQDFTTGSWSLFGNPDRRIIGLNTQAFDSAKHRALPLVADARVGLAALDTDLEGWTAPAPWTAAARAAKTEWAETAAHYTAETNAERPTDAQVIGAVQRRAAATDIVVCAAGGLPGELHKLWRAGASGGYHLEYGYSCMGYEIAAGIGVKLAEPERDVFVLLGDGSYLMANSELVSAVALGLKLTVVLLDNRGFGCINRLQKATGGAPFNNLWADTVQEQMPAVDFAAHAASMGAAAEKVAGIADLEAALERARSRETGVTVLVIDTDPQASTDAGGHWWEVAVPEVSVRTEVRAAREGYEAALKAQRLGD